MQLRQALRGAQATSDQAAAKRQSPSRRANGTWLGRSLGKAMSPRRAAGSGAGGWWRAGGTVPGQG
jgi:hypothetical protein